MLLPFLSCCFRPFVAVWQMLLPLWLMLLPFFLTCCVGQMLVARVADGIAYPGGCGVWCYDHVWQME